MVDVEAKLYEILGIVRMIGNIQISDDLEGRLHDLEAATWSARAAETIVTETLALVES